MITANSLSSSSAVDIDFGSNITLSCTSSGSPPDIFTWMKDGVPVTQSTSITAVTYDDNSAVFSSDYTISNFSLTDNGTYTCTVTNPIGSDDYTFIVNIRKFLNQAHAQFLEIVFIRTSVCVCELETVYV